MIERSAHFRQIPWVAAIFGTFLLPGCSATYHVALDRETAYSDTLTIVRLNNRLSQRPVILHKVDGEDLHGTFLRSAQDTCYLLTKTATDPTAVPATEIRTVEFRDHWGGTVGGFFAGFFGGLVLGTAVVLITNSGGHEAPPMYGLAVWITSMVAGPIIGGLNGIPNTFEFPQPRSEHSLLQDTDSTLERGLKTGDRAFVLVSSDSGSSKVR